MKIPCFSAFAAIFHNEVLFNVKRAAPYFMMVFFTSNALMWWGWGPAIGEGWATNSDYYIIRNIQSFSWLLGLPIFDAVIMGEPVIRDFRLQVNPLIFSKPIGRLQYLLGKFFGSFFVLVCCQSVFMLTLMGLQAIHKTNMIVQPVRVWPYVQHFFFFVVISHLGISAIYFTLGTFTRNAKFVYGFAICFYPLWISYHLVILRNFPVQWRTILDPLMLFTRSNGGWPTAEWANSYVFSFTSPMVANRVLVILITTACLAFLYFRFRITEQADNQDDKPEVFSMLNLATGAEKVYFNSETLAQATSYQQLAGRPAARERGMPKHVSLPKTTRASKGLPRTFDALVAALGVELRLLRAERSLVVLVPLGVLLPILEIAFYQIVPEVSYSATYASNTARSLLLIVLGITVFFTGEAMHRDRDLRIDPILWTTPVPNAVILLSKFLGTLLLTLSLTALVGFTALVVQLLRGHFPINIGPYLLTYVVILVPSIVLLTSLCMALNVLLRNKYLSYVIVISIGAGLFYLYTMGYNHWLYNPVLYELWSYADLTGAGSNQAIILVHRAYCLAIAGFFLALAHLFCQRRAPKNGSSLFFVLISIAIALVTGWTILSWTT